MVGGGWSVCLNLVTLCSRPICVVFPSDTGIFSVWVELMYKLNITTNFTV
jgi:hypothetical protein